MNIARDAVQQHAQGRSLKEIHFFIKEKYGKYGEPTPTPVPNS